jgi:hypothetical protein
MLQRAILHSLSVSPRIILSLGSPFDAPVRFKARREWEADKWIPKAAKCIADKASCLFHSVRMCIKIFELDGWFVRLRLEAGFLGSLVWFWLPRLHRRLF